MRVRRSIIVLSTMGLLGLGALLVSVSHGKSEPYCKSKYMYEDMGLVASMNICMATVACTFPRTDVFKYVAAGKRLNICAEQARIQRIPEPQELPRRD